MDADEIARVVLDSSAGMSSIRERIGRGREVVEHQAASDPLNFASPKEGLAMKATLTKSDVHRFWSKVDVTDTCWLWIGYTSRGGYGRFSVHGGGETQSFQAHRVAYELDGRPLPEGMVLDHICRIRACVNPDHLRPLSNVENVMIGIGPSAINARKTHCIHGHPFSPENTYWKPRAGRSPVRQCRECKHAAHKSLPRVPCSACDKTFVNIYAARTHEANFHGIDWRAAS